MQKLLLVTAGTDGEREETSAGHRIRRLIDRVRPGPNAATITDRSESGTVVVDTRGGGSAGDIAERIRRALPGVRNAVTDCGHGDGASDDDEGGAWFSEHQDSQTAAEPVPLTGESRSLMRQVFAQELVAGIHSPNTSAVAAALGFDELPVIAMAVNLDPPDQAANGAIPLAIPAAVAAVDRALGGLDGHGLCAPVPGGEMCVLLTAGVSPDPVTAARTVGDSIVAGVMEDAGVSVTVGIGCYSPRLEDLPRSFVQASAAGRYGQVTGQRVTEYRDIPNNGRVQGSHPFIKERQLADLVQFGDEQGARQAAGVLCDLLASVHPEASELTSAVVELIIVLSRAACRGGVEPERIMPLKQRLIGDVRTSRSYRMQRLAAIRAAGEFARANIPRPAGLTMIDSARAYIESNASGRLTLGDVAAHLDLNPSYCSRLFKREAGMTFVEYLARVRVDNAKHLLATTGLEMKDIARATGFHSQSYFSLVFRKLEGVPPSKYRSWFEPSGNWEGRRTPSQK